MVPFFEGRSHHDLQGVLGFLERVAHRVLEEGYSLVPILLVAHGAVSQRIELQDPHHLLGFGLPTVPEKRWMIQFRSILPDDPKLLQMI